MTKLNIVNKALLRVGQRVLQSLDEDSADSKLINILFDSTVEETLREGKFGSTIKRVELVQIPSSPLFGYNNAFQLPADSIRVIDCYDSRGEYNPHLYWEIENGLVLSDASVLYCKYVYVPTDFSKLDALAARAVSLQLSIQLAYPKTKSGVLVGNLITEYETLMLQKAKSFSTLENHEEGIFGEVDWIRSRRL